MSSTCPIPQCGVLLLPGCTLTLPKARVSGVSDEDYHAMLLSFGGQEWIEQYADRTTATRLEICSAHVPPDHVLSVQNGTFRYDQASDTFFHGILHVPKKPPRRPHSVYCCLVWCRHTGQAGLRRLNVALKQLRRTCGPQAVHKALSSYRNHSTRRLRSSRW